MSFGVKVTPWGAVPKPGKVAGVVQPKVPAGVADPPLSVEDASVWPYVIALAVGHAVTFGLALPTLI
jgi:hypothetical protein